jgi:hypothetical protein
LGLQQGQNPSRISLRQAEFHHHEVQPQPNPESVLRFPAITTSYALCIPPQQMAACLHDCYYVVVRAVQAFMAADNNVPEGYRQYAEPYMSSNASSGQDIKRSLAAQEPRTPAMSPTAFEAATQKPRMLEGARLPVSRRSSRPAAPTACAHTYTKP